LSSWNYGDKYAKYKSETISLKRSQICLLLQQKYNKTVQVQVTIIPRQPGKELSVPVTITLWHSISKTSLDFEIVGDECQGN
jgi:hypothetical protein